MDIVQKERIIKITAGSIAAVTLATHLWVAKIDYRYLVSNPRMPNALTGEIYPLDQHGAVVYLNAEQNRRRQIFVRSDIAGIVIAGCLVGYLGTNRRKLSDRK